MKRFIAFLFFCLFSFFNFNYSSAKVLNVGVNAEFPPFEFVSSSGIVDQFDGFDIALIKAIADDLGMELKLENMEFDSLIMSLKTEKIDLTISALTITKERKRTISFSDPYFIAKQVMIVPENSTIKKASDMADKRIAVRQGYTGEIIVRKMGYSYEAYKNIADAVMELKNGKCDVVVLDHAVAHRFCSDIKEITVLEDDKAFGIEEYGIAVNKNNTQLLKQINTSLEKLKKSGTMDALLKKYIQ